MRHLAGQFGLVCASGVWLGGTRIGRFEEKQCGLSGPLQNLDRLALHLDCLWDDRLSGLNDRDTHSYLLRALYSDDPTRSDKEVNVASREFCRYVFLTNSSECFDGYNGFVFRRPGEDPVAIVSTADESLVHAPVRLQGFAAAVRYFGLWHASVPGRRLTNGSSDRGVSSPLSQGGSR
jgi:hypothetical protein